MKNENPLLKEERASRVSLPNSTPEAHNPLTLQIQLLVSNYAVCPELAAVLAAAAYGGGSHGR